MLERTLQVGVAGAGSFGERRFSLRQTDSGIGCDSKRLARERKRNRNCRHRAKRCACMRFYARLSLAFAFAFATALALVAIERRTDESRRRTVVATNKLKDCENCCGQFSVSLLCLGVLFIVIPNNLYCYTRREGYQI